MCKYNKYENLLLGLPEDEPCTLEKLGIRCSDETVEACRRAEACLACKRTDCTGCELEGGERS